MGYVLFQEDFDAKVWRLQSRLAGARTDEPGESGAEAPPVAAAGSSSTS